MTELCGHPTPSGPCRRTRIPGSSGCGLLPAPPDPQEERHPEPVKTCKCERPLVLGRADNDIPFRCFLCSRPVEALLDAEGGPGQVDAIESRSGDDPVRDHDRLVLRLLGEEQD